MVARVATRPSEARFRYEADMVPVLRAWLPRLAFRHESVSPVEVFTEVPAIHGVPDLAAIRFVPEAVRQREEAGVRPLTTDTEVRAVMHLSRGPQRVRELSDLMGMGPDYLRRAVVPLLVDLGWVRFESGWVERNPAAVWTGRRVVTVEAKLRDWRGAISQARRQQLSADAAYVALDVDVCHRIFADLDHIANSGIGVVAVDAARQAATVLVRPRRLPRELTAVGRALVAERSLDMLRRGTREGQIYPVFGWTQPTS